MESYGKKYIYKITGLLPYPKQKQIMNEPQIGEDFVLCNNKIKQRNNNDIISNESSNISYHNKSGNYDIIDGVLKKKSSASPNHKIQVYHIKNTTKDHNHNKQQVKHSNSISEGKENDMTTEGSSFHKVQNQSSYENDCTGTHMHFVNVKLQNNDNNNKNSNTNNSNNNININPLLEFKTSLPKILYNKKIRHERPYFNKIKEPQLLKHSKQENKNEMDHILNDTQFKPKTKKEYLQCFGSTVQKLPYNSHNKQTDKIGPGSYSLNYNTISEKLKRTLNFTKGFSTSLTPSNNLHKILKYKNKHNQPGPGWYNIASSFIKKSFSNYSTFLSSERRFSLTDLSYKNNMRSLHFPEHNSNKDTNQPNKPQYIQYSMNERYLRKTASSDILNIDYNKVYLQHHYKTKILNDTNNIQNKQNINQQAYAPFGSYIERFEDPVNKQEIYSDYSPGQYSGDLIKKYQHGNKQFFFRNDYGIVKDFFGNNGIDSPGYKNLDSYFDWHKKSYNTMYINN